MENIENKEAESSNAEELLQKQLKEKDCLFAYEGKYAELDEITTMFWYILEDYYTGQKKDIYTKANNYDRLYTYLFNVHTLLYDRMQEMKNFIDEQYKENKKVGEQ